MSRLKGIADLFTPRSRRRAATRRRKPSRPQTGKVRALESLESRAMLAVSYAYDDASETLTVNMTGSDNSAVIEFAVLADGPEADAARVLGARLSASGLTETVLVPVNAIVINVADPAVATNNRVSFGIIPFDSAFDLSSFVFEGNGASGSGHFTCSTSTLKSTCSLNLTNIDAVSFSQADEIRLDGTFSNDTGDAEVGVVWQSLAPDVTEVIIGTNRPLVADTIRVESAKSITFFNPVTATSDLTLRSNSPLDIDYDIKAGGTLVLDGTDGVTQRASATIVATALKVVSRDGTTTTGIVSLDSDLNDFDTVQISSDTSGQISLRDVDDLVVSESGISADAGRVVLDVRGALTIASTILALGLNVQSGASVLATPTASMTLGAEGLQIYATDSFDELATGDVTLNAPIHIQAADATKLVSNKIRSAGATLIAGGLYVPSAGITTIEADGGLVVAGPIQVGSTKLDANSKTATVFDHDLTLVSHAGVITVEDVPGNDAVPSAIQATNIISFDAAKTIDIRGAVFAGSRAGDATSRPASEALPAITIVGDAAVVIADTGSLQTQAYENDAATFANPLLGRISIDAATQFDLQGAIRADGPVDVSSAGDVYLYGPLTARESVAVETSRGSIDVQGAVRTTGWTYTSEPPAVLVAQRLPNILLSAPGGGITTSGLGTLSAGVMTTGTGEAAATVAGDIELQAQQGIDLGAGIFGARDVRIASKVGAVAIQSRLVTGSEGTTSINAGAGVSLLEFGAIESPIVQIINSSTGDVALVSQGNKIETLDIVNHAESGLVGVTVDGTTTVSQLRADGDVAIGASGLLTVAGVISSRNAGIRLDLHSGLLQTDASGLSAIEVIAGGSGYSPNATLTIAAPQGGGRAATAVPVMGRFGEVIGVVLTDPGAGYGIGENPPVTIDDGDGAGAGAAFDSSGPSSLGGILAKTDILIESRGDVTLLGTVVSSEQGIKLSLAEGNVVLGAASLLIAQGPATFEANAGGVSVGGEVRADAVNVNVTSGAFTVLDNAEIVATDQSIQVSLANQSTATISGDMVAEEDINIEGQLAAVSVNGLLEAKNGDISIDALTVTQSTETGITKFEVVSGGAGYGLGAIIVVPAPTSGTGRPARAEAVIDNGSIVSVTIIDPGSGYAVGQEIRIVVEGVPGPPQNNGPGTPPGQGAVVVAYGPAAVKDIAARKGTIGIFARQDIALSSQLLANSKIVVNSDYGTVDLSPASSFLNVLADAGTVQVTADQGAVRINRAEAGSDISLQAQGDVEFRGRIITANGDFLATSKLAQVKFKGAEVFAEKGSFGVVAGGYVLQESDSGIAKLEILSGGQGYSEDTTLEIAAPRNGGVRATAVLTIGENRAISGVTIVNPGSGYEPGEVPEVKVVDPVSDGGFNGFLRAFGPENVRQVKAKNIDIEAGLGVRLGTAFEALDGDLTVVSKSGTVDLGGGSVSLNASDGVIVTAENGNVVVQRINAGKDVELGGYLTTKVLGRVVANGDEGIQIKSTLGQVVVANTLLAKAGEILINAGGTFEQRNESGITAIEVLNAGNGYSREVGIEIAAPRNGGIPARAVPILDNRGGIARVLVIDPGSGYEIGESPAVTVIEQNAGPDGDGGVNAALTAVGPSEQYDINAQLGIAIKANLGVRGGGGLISQSQGIEITATSGTVDFSQGAAFLRALDPENGVVTIEAPEGLVLAPQSSVGKSLAASAAGGVIINGDLVGVEDDIETNITLSSSSGVVDLSAGDIAIDGQLKISGSRVRQLGASGVQKLRIASGGEQYTQRVTIEIDPPASGFGRAATATAIVQQGVIIDTVITDPGSGYAIGESPLVTVRGETQFFNGNFLEVGAGAAIFAVGPTEIRDVRADAGVEIVSVGDVVLSSQFRSNSGAFEVQSSLGDIDLAAGSFVAEANGISVTAALGSVKVELLNAGNDGVKIEAGDAVDLNGGLLSVGGVTIASRLGNIDITGAAISVEDGDLTLAAADGGVIQQETTGITQIQVIEVGEDYFSGATVTVAEPSAAGGRQATAEAVIRAGRIVRIVVTDPGSGYAPGEQPRVTIRGENGANGSPQGRGAVALARAPDAVRNISALNGTIRVQSGTDSSLTSIVTARDIEVSSTRGNVNLGGGTLFLDAVGGSVVAAADRGRVSVRRISAGTDVTLAGHIDVTVSSRVDATNGAITVTSTGGGMTLRNFLAGEQIKAVALGNTSLEGYFKSGSNDIDVESTFGAILLNAELKADAGAVRLAAFSDVYQSSSTGITAIEVTAQGDGFAFGAEVVVAPPRNNPDGLAARAQANVRRVDFVVGLQSRTRWFIESIDIVFPGVGYAIGENPDVQILLLDAAGDPVGSGGAEARATGPTGPRKITAAEDIEVTAGGKVTFVQPLESTNGNIAVRTTGGELNVNATQLIAREGGVVVDATVGSAFVNDVLAKTDVVIKSREALQLTGLIDTAAGSVELISFAGDVVFKDGAVIHADLGDVTLASPNGQVSAPPVLNVGGNVDISSFKTLRLESEIVAATGDVDVNVASGSLLFSGNIVASTGSVSLRSDSATVTQVDSSGIRFVQVLAGGSNYTGDVRVVIAAPAGGGVTAEARATVGTAEDGTVGAILEITITNPGSGYAVNESPEVTITPANPGQGSGAVALATGPSGLANVLGWNGVTIAGAGGVTLVSAVRSPMGDITIQSASGSLDMAADAFLAHAAAGGVTLTSSAGTVAVQQVIADDAVVISGATGVAIEGSVDSVAGSVFVTSTAGGVVTKDIYAELDIALTTAQDIRVSGLVQATKDLIRLETTSGLIAMEADAKLHAVEGSVELIAKRGQATLQNVFAGQDISLDSLGDVTLTKNVHSVNGNLTVVSQGGIDNAGIVEVGDSISLSASRSVTSLGGGVVRIDLLSGGSNYDYAIVTIAGPASGGGRAATARATVTGGVVTAITLVDPGYGYASGELVRVTIEGQSQQTSVGGPAGAVPRVAEGARAQAFAAQGSSLLIAGEHITIKGGTLVEITNQIQAKAGDVTIDASAGPIKLSEIFAGEDVSLKAMQTVSLGGLLRTATGNVDIESLGGGLDMRGTILAPAGGVEIDTAGPVVQRGGSVSRGKIFLLSGGRDYTYALVVVTPPPGAGETALARAVITDRNPFDDEEGGYISEIVLLDSGWGYPSDSRVNVTIQGDGEGAVAVFGTDVVTSSIDARDNVRVRSGDSVTLVSTVRSELGDVEILTTLGDVSVESITAGGAIDVASNRGEVTLVSVSGKQDVGVNADQGLSVTDSLNTVAGNISLETTNGDITFVKKLDFGDNFLVDDAATVIEPESVISTKLGGITMTAHNGTIVSPYVINAALDVKLTSLLALELTNQITSQSGDIAVESASSLVRLRSNMVAEEGSITVEAQTALLQEFASGISKIELLSPGPMQDVPPAVTVTIAPPRNGGAAATAFAIIERRALDNTNNNNGLNNFNNVIEYEYFIGSIAIIDPGFGYEVGENPVVIITGVDGATARAYGPNMVAMLTAQADINLLAGENITLLTKIHAVEGNVTIASKAGDIDLSADSLFVSSKAGGIDIAAYGGSVELQRLSGFKTVTVSAEERIDVLQSVVSRGGSIDVVSTNNAVNVRQLDADQDVTVSGFRTSTLVGEIVATNGDVNATSTAGGLRINANIVAGEDITLEAQTFLEQLDRTGIEDLEIISEGSERQVTLTPVPPTVTVTVAAPAAAGGRAATARAILGRRFLGNDPSGTNPIFEYFIEKVEIIDAGGGYAIGENPIVTIAGMAGAVVRGIGPTNLRYLTAGSGIEIDAGSDISLRYDVISKAGDVGISSVGGAVSIAAVVAAGGVTLTSSAGTVAVQQVTADDAVVINGATGVEIEGVVNSATGTVTVDSTAGEAMIRTILAGDSVIVGASHDVTLIGVIDSESGDVSITSRNRDLDFTAAGAQVHALQGGVSLAAVNGTIMSPPTLHASKDVTLTSFNTLALNNEITSDTGVIDLKSTSGSINLGSNLDARDDSIRIHAKGSVTQIGGGIGFVRMLTGGSGYTAAATVAIAAPSAGGIAARGVPIIGRVNGVDGVITGIRITNPGSGYGAGEQPAVTFTRNAVPPQGVTWLDASVMAVASPALGNSGLAAIDVVDGGSGYTAATTVTIAAPVGGGTAATAQAVIGTVEVNGILTDGVILDIVIVNPGSGYGAGEQPVVTIDGAGTGAVARAIANIALQDIRGGKDIDIYAGTGVTLLNTIRADQGGVSITGETGNVNLAARTLLVSSFMDDIEITSRRGAIAVQRLAADGDITVKAQTGVTLLNAVNSTGDFDTGNVSIYTVNGNIAAVAPNGLISVQNGGVSLESVNGTVLVPQVFNVTGDVSLKTFGNLTVNQPLTSSAGSVTLASATGAVNIAANVFADERVTLSAKTGISQTKGFIKGDELVARNSTTSAVNLTNPANDFANVSLMSLGTVSYVDANDFETGVERSPYSGTPLGVEVRGESLSLSSVGANSRIRVVSGLSYRTLSIAAGTQGGNNVGYVEYVTTSGGDNPQTNAPFQGTLRDMIRYVNDNTATYLNAGNTRVSQPQMMVFDETGYLVAEVSPAAALPAFSRPVWFDGGRLEETATANRLGISGNSALLHGLSFAAATPAVTGVRPATPGSSGSRVENLAVYGFTKGSGVVLASGNNTVVDLHAGLKADGTVSGNMIGLDVRGTAAINNTIGEQVVDAETVSRFAANTLAGIVIRSGAAGTQVFGSVIGDDSGANPALANGDGIQIVNATRSQIGSANAVEDDLYASRSNIIAGNLSAGVRISNAVAGTLAAANVIRNNVIRGNRTGVDISASAFAVLGGPDAGAANVITGQTLSGVVVTDSRSVQIQGNRIGVVPASGDQPEAVAGNGADGIAISGKSQAVEISGGNWIGGNTAHGVRIGSGVTGVMMRGNTIGGELADGSAAGNGQDGVAITAAIGNTIGAGNVIARNGRHGVSITDARAETLLAGNRVFGSTISGNQSNGVLISGGSRTTIGGPTVADANLIQGNEVDGIRLVSTSVTSAATGHVIQRNYVGSNPAGDVNTELGNKGSGIALVGTSDVVVGDANVVMNNGVDGIAVNGGRGVTIGSANAAVGNQIRSNARHGVSFNGAATGGRVMGNLIEGQGGDGVFVDSGARDVRIGHIVTRSGVSGAANVVQGNAGWGVRVMPGAQQIAVQGNSSFGNMQGALSRAAGANAAAPSSVTLTSAVMRTATGGTRQLVVTGTIAGARARQQYSVDVYASSVGESAQGRRHLGRFNVTATADGLLRFNSTITATVAVDEWISVAATTLVFDPGSTSHLSAPVKAALR